MRSVILIASAFSASSAMTCPGSAAWLGHAKTEVTATIAASCDDVKAEIIARADGGDSWVDPHNGGKYTYISEPTPLMLQTERTANPKKSVLGRAYVDKQTFTLTVLDGGSCKVEACSESQGVSQQDFSTNYCDIRNLYCGKADGCSPVKSDFVSTEVSVVASSGQHDLSACVVTPTVPLSVAQVEGSTKCPGSKAFGPHAKTKVIATTSAPCESVKQEIIARVGGQNGWVDPHNGGVYKVVSSDSYIETKRSTNPKKAVLGKTYVDKQIFTLTPTGHDFCQIEACSESQGTSVKDYSTNYCDIRNLYCGKADGCTSVLFDFTTEETKVEASSGQHDASACVVKSDADIQV